MNEKGIKAEPGCLYIQFGDVTQLTHRLYALQRTFKLYPMLHLPSTAYVAILRCDST